ncbi:hypothetical protein ASPWEDRAFT_320690 [Aspergillus wentii DTO 134E9]|uniref:FAD-binding domain-containing protein n=1 Tax=Aspergillus wentii DTO 134E9 TaxID=1073089 RepID=A0A1L9RTV5_ASPWE|nr:uncharacterized protein ASPWEDRAFT_320690 [Aspergillus wentii DTO 134E9]OJJ38359.1 hypothetical protein ASPWEDRAFT_320690 [Aspergillus wentii DTO 134E9]
MAAEIDILDDIAIIGAGIAGIALAIALSQRSIPCKIYESKSKDAGTLGSGVTLGPNGCLVLDRLGLFDRVASRSYRTESHAVKDAQGNTTTIGNVATEELYGYSHHRIYRLTLFQELRAALEECKVPVQYDAKFDKVIEETDEGVRFIVNGEIQKASLLIGADGIHSVVRKHLTSELPQYLGLACIYGHVPTDSIAWPRSFEKDCTIQDDPGAFFMIPEVHDGTEMMAARQFVYPALDRAGWEALAADPDALVSLLCKDYHQWKSGIVKSLMDQLQLRKDGLLLWPFYRMPKLPTWASPTARTIIIGDAAHAMPPSSAQGVNQALEDAYTLSLMLTLRSPGTSLTEALDFWHGMRQDRIDAILKMAERTNAKRLPKTERPVATQVDKSHDLPHALDDLHWLYRPTMEEEITAWFGIRT